MGDGLGPIDAGAVALAEAAGGNAPVLEPVGAVDDPGPALAPVPVIAPGTVVPPTPVLPLGGLTTTMVVGPGTGAAAGTGLAVPLAEGALPPVSPPGSGAAVAATAAGELLVAAASLGASVPGMITVAVGGTGSSFALSQPAPSRAAEKAAPASHRRR